MAEEREKKRKKSHSHGEPEPAPARNTQDMKAGELLRHVREEKGMELEEISSAIHVRVAQLRSIEEGHIESLPGMTYALGFVKSYASYLKLDPTQVANKFKAEHSVTPPKPDLKFPEPMAEHKMPDMFMIGAAVAGVVVLLGVWFFFSGGEEKTVTNVATAIPAPPAEIAPLVAPTNTTGVEATGGSILSQTPAGAVTSSATTATAVATSTAPVATTAPAAPAAATTAPATIAAATPATKPETPAAATTAAATTATTAAPAATSKPSTAATQTTLAQTADETKPAAGKSEVINIKPGKGRVVLQATQSTWVQITDSSGNVVLKQVLRPGDRYYVPDQNGLHMVTSNAGALNVYVDGRQTKSIGNSGEIVRGVSLNPDSLNNGTVTRRRSLVHD